MDFSHLEKIIVHKKRSPVRAFQVRALEVCKELGIKNKHVGIMMKLAKESPLLFEKTYTFMKDYNNPKTPERLFVWYYHKLKNKEPLWSK